MLNPKDKYVFTDVDGVFNSERWYKKRYNMPEYKEYRLNKKEITDEDYHKWEFDPKAVERFNKIIEATDAKIVVSSTWRSDPKIREIFKAVGIKGEIVGITPRLWWNDIQRNNPFGEGDRHANIPRGLEIDEWICNNFYANYDEYKGLKYIIIDDDSDMLYRQRKMFVHTSWKTGLLLKHADKAIKILNVDKK